MKPTRPALLGPRALGLLLLPVVAATIAGFFVPGVLETRVVLATLYPVVMMAALSGGWLLGLLSAGACSLIAAYGWPLLAGRSLTAGGADLLAFLLSATVISAVAEVARHALAQAVLARERAEAASDTKKRFLARVGRDLLTPLNAILGFSSLLRNDASVSAEQRRTLDLINRSAQHLHRLTNEILDAARAEARPAAIEDAVFDLRATMWEIADLMRRRAEAKGLALTLDIAEGVPRTIGGDQGKLRQAAVSLVSHVVDSSSRGVVTLRLATRPQVEATAITLVVEVGADGIAAEDPAGLVEPGVLSGQESDREGTRPGLLVAHRLVGLMGGAIRVERRAGAGSRFRAEVPMRLVHLGRPGDSVQSPFPVAGGSPAGLNPESLAAVPLSLRGELGDALVSLDAARIAGAIRRVAEGHPTLGGVLGRHARQLEYTVILRALQSCPTVVEEKEGTA